MKRFSASTDLSQKDQASASALTEGEMEHNSWAPTLLSQCPLHAYMLTAHMYPPHPGSGYRVSSSLPPGLPGAWGEGHKG